ncbi:hypothetical protein [Sorangium sp. So ce1024]|uniref:hypothetical protein n=1 Tax=Sorangium sp. So ce1024 TaxID=3133327 RepID=UPI003F0A15D2
MSLHRYFQRAHDEARRLLAERPGLLRPSRIVAQAPRWQVAMVLSNSGECVRAYRDGEVQAAVRSATRDYVAGWPEVHGVARVLPSGLDRILDRAMVDTDGSPTLAPGQGAEARRLLEMVAWDRVPQARWPAVFEALRVAAVSGTWGEPNWQAVARSLLARGGWLTEESKAA